jgi:hypothetical protein
VRNTVRADDVAARLDSQVLSQVPPPNRLSEAGLDMSDREFVAWRTDMGADRRFAGQSAKGL